MGPLEVFFSLDTLISATENSQSLSFHSPTLVTAESETGHFPWIPDGSLGAAPWLYP